MKKVVMFNGSPRMDGNISTILNVIGKGAQDAGADVKNYTLFKMKFRACQGCFSCRVNDDCAIHDELHESLQKIKEADAIVIGSPIYMMQMTGPVKNLYDRFFPLMDSGYKARFGVKKMVTVYSQALDDPTAFKSYFDYTASIFPAFGFDLMDNIVCINANDPESSERNAELKIRAYEAGRALVA